MFMFCFFTILQDTEEIQTGRDCSLITNTSAATKQRTELWTKIKLKYDETCADISILLLL